MNMYLERRNPTKDPADYMSIKMVTFKTTPDGRLVLDQCGRRIPDKVRLVNHYQDLRLPLLVELAGMKTFEMSAEDFEAICKAKGYNTLLREYYDLVFGDTPPVLI